MSRPISFELAFTRTDPEFRIGRVPPFSRQELSYIPADCERTRAPTPTRNATCRLCDQPVASGKFVCNLDCAAALRRLQGHRQLQSVQIWNWAHRDANPLLFPLTPQQVGSVYSDWLLCAREDCFNPRLWNYEKDLPEPCCSKSCELGFIAYSWTATDAEGSEELPSARAVHPRLSEE